MMQDHTRMSSQGKGACSNRIGVIVLFVLIDRIHVKLRCMSVTHRTVTRNEPSLTEIQVSIGLRYMRQPQPTDGIVHLIWSSLGQTLRVWL